MDCSTTRCLLVLLLATGLGACASVPPPESQMGKADLALRKAEQADAAHFAPLEMRTARTKLEAARAAMQEKNNLEARRLAEQAKLDALLAEATAQTAQRREATDTIRADIEALRAEAERASNRIPGETQ
jgi:outer membrane PBP1 activator LpoA protein